MPKDKTSKYSRLRHFVSEFGDEVFSIDASILFCKLCECKFNVTQHLKTDKHLKAIKREQNKIEKKQQLLTNIPRKCTFNIDLCKTLISANIPLNKLSNYTKNHIPDESTLRKLYVNDIYIYNETIEKIRSQVANNRIWMSIDETTDVEGRKVFDKSMSKLWPNGIQHDSVLLFLSDAAPYMKKGGKSLKVFYSKMFHVACAAHGLHRIAEQVLDHFSNVDKKAPTRVEIFKIEAPGICLPPDPIITRWGSWINAAIYY
ncbi:BED-type domain-containing protein, partial [Aphis craccivora]